MTRNSSAASPSGAARTAQNSKAFEALARVGYVVLGILHILIGAIAISIAGGGGGEADQGGAIEQVKQNPAGVFLLWVIVVGLFALAIWQIAEAFLERDPDAKKKWAHRVKFIGTAIAYIAIGGTALTYALGGSSDSSESSQSLSATLLAAPAGVALLVLVGLVVAGIGVAFVVRGILKKFTKHLALPTGTARKGIVAFGVAGYVAKGIAVGVAGILFVVAAVTHDAEAAGGLDAALRALAELPYGPIILWVVGAGLVLYGLFCIARARYARM
jgi:cytochrome bd-type quinol oxidase subunit 2